MIFRINKIVELRYYKLFVELLYFSMSGIFGFIVDSSILYALKIEFGLYVARLVSFFCAVMVTWYFNRVFTYRNRFSNTKIGKEISSYFLLMLIGGAINYGVYVIAVSQFDLISMHPIIAVALGSIAGMLVNWITSRTLLFKFE